MYKGCLALVATSAADLQRMVDALYEYACKWHVVVNTVKTKIMIFHQCYTGDSYINIATHQRAHLNGGCTFTYNVKGIDSVSTFKYLGTMFHEDLKRSRFDYL